MGKIENAVAKQILLRAKVGEKKYGTTMDRDDLSLGEWLQHLQEELLDAAVYVEKLKQERQYNVGPCSAHAFESEYMYDGECSGELGSHPLCSTDYCPCKEEEIEKRMNIIGQNGNTGDHYDSVDVAVSTEKPCGWDSTRSVYPGDIEITYEWVTNTKEKKERKQ